MAGGKKGDLGPTATWEPLSWAPDQAVESLGTAFARVRGRAVVTHGWYLARRVWKSRWSKLLRFVIVVAIGVAATFPVIELADRDVQVAKYGYIAVAVGGGVFALDRAFSLTSGWMRYIATGLVIQAQIERNDLLWERRMAEIGPKPTPADIVDRLDDLVSMVNELHALVHADTEQWSAEIASTLTQLETAASAVAHQRQLPGS